MQIETFIRNKINDSFTPLFLSIDNESYKHGVENKSVAESHFKLVVVSDKFIDKRQIERHKLIYNLLSDIFSQGVHALALHTYTAAEWQKKQRSTPKTPNCLGGSTAN